MTSKYIFRFAFISLLANQLVGSDEFDFNMDELEKIELKQYDYSGYLNFEHKHQVLNKNSLMYPSKNKDSQESFLGELFFNYKYFQDKITFNTDFVANYEDIDKDIKDTYIINQAVFSYKFDEFHEVNLGKKTPKWGKGYFFNPIAFIDRKKDPNKPEANKEGFSQINYKFNKVYDSDLKNIGLDISYIPTSEDLNNELYPTNSDILALKLYMLYRDIDIDIAYLYNNQDVDKIGIDFSTNLETNFEIHGEFAKDDKDKYSYLMGLKYLTDNELTITSEYFYQNEQLLKNQPFWDNRYLINKLNQKDPFSFLYWNIYYMNSLNLEDNSHQNTIGFTNTKIKNLTLDFSITKMNGDKTTEYGTKLIDSYSWLQLKYSF